MTSSAARTALDLTADLPVPALEDFYRDLHRHPELSLREHRTAALLAERLRKAGYETADGVGGTGVVGVLRNGDGPTVLLRADMDALPVTEETGLPYASETAGVMHACGHDLHVTWLTGAADALAAGRDTWSGTLVVLGQPAEETGEGAARMVADGLYERFPRPDVLLAQHAAPGPAGLYAHSPGLIMSAATDIDIVVHGLGGHGSRPEATVDPVVTAAYIVTRLQTVVSREIAARDSAVLTVGRIEAGTRHNIIPSEARIALNLRTQSEDVRERMIAAIRRIAAGECAAVELPARARGDRRQQLPGDRQRPRHRPSYRRRARRGLRRRDDPRPGSGDGQRGLLPAGGGRTAVLLLVRDEHSGRRLERGPRRRRPDAQARRRAQQPQPALRPRPEHGRAGCADAGVGGAGVVVGGVT